jgi:hypothetical protein
MQIHVFECTSSRPLARGVAKHHLALCMLAMEELGKSFVSAVAAHKLFSTAVQKVDRARGGAEQEPPTTTRVAVAPMLPADDGMQAFASSSAVWESWPEGYAASTAGVIADVWLPWMWGLGNQ